MVVWDLEKGSALCGAPVSSSAAGIGNAVQFCNRSDTVFVTGGDSTVRIWEIDVDNRKLRPTDVSLGALRRCAFSIVGGSLSWLSFFHLLDINSILF